MERSQLPHQPTATVTSIDHLRLVVAAALTTLGLLIVCTFFVHRWYNFSGEQAADVYNSKLAESPAYIESVGAIAGVDDERIVRVLLRADEDTFVAGDDEPCLRGSAWDYWTGSTCNNSQATIFIPDDVNGTDVTGDAMPEQTLTLYLLSGIHSLVEESRTGFADIGKARAHLDSVSTRWYHAGGGWRTIRH